MALTNTKIDVQKNKHVFTQRMKMPVGSKVLTPGILTPDIGKTI